MRGEAWAALEDLRGVPLAYDDPVQTVPFTTYTGLFSPEESV